MLMKDSIVKTIFESSSHFIVVVRVRIFIVAEEFSVERNSKCHALPCPYSVSRQGLFFLLKRLLFLRNTSLTNREELRFFEPDANNGRTDGRYHRPLDGTGESYPYAGFETVRKYRESYRNRRENH